MKPWTFWTALLTMLIPAVAGAQPVATSSIYGRLQDGRHVHAFNLKNASGMQVQVIEYGATLSEVKLPMRGGEPSNVILAADSLAGFEKGFPSGSIIGRYANRIRNARFSLDGKEYQVTKNAGEHHIHGGKINFAKVLWNGKVESDAKSARAILKYTSKDGEEGFPGTLEVTVTYSLTNSNELAIVYAAATDKATVVNLTNHVYFNLGKPGTDVLNHQLQLFADEYTIADEKLIPTGEIASVEGTPLDFRSPHAIGERIAQTYAAAGGYDHNFIVRGAEGTLRIAAKVEEPTTGRKMECWTTEPGVQLYTANGFNNNPFPRHGAFCLETQHYPDSPNQPKFPTTTLRPGVIFDSETVFRFQW